MHNRHKVGLVLFFMICFLIVQSPAYADDPGKAALPSIDRMFDGMSENPYFTKYRDNYYLDMVDYNSLLDPTGMFNELANLLFMTQVLAGYVLIVIFYFSFEIDIYHLFSSIVNTFVGEMKISLFDELSLVAITILGLYYVVMMLKDQKTQIWVAIFQTIIIVALAYQFYTNPTGLLKGIDDFSKGAARQVLAGTYKANHKGEDPDSAVAAAANEIWMMFVHRPWQLLEFGDIQMAQKEETRILSLPPESDARNKIIEDIAKNEENFTVAWGLKRLAFMMMYALPLALNFIGIALLCVLMLAYQVLTVLLASLGVFIFILALIPFFGIRTVQNWFIKVVGAGCIKVVVAFFLGILVVFNAALFKLIGIYGWLFVMILQLVIAGVIYWKREAFFELFTTMRLAPQNAAALNKQLRKDTNLESYIREYTKNMGFRKSRDFGYHYEENDYTGALNHTAAKDTQPQGYRYRPKEAAILTTSTTGPSFEQLYHEIQEDTNNDNENFKNLMKKAEEILEKQYEISKAASEEKAEKLQREPEYTPFVYKVQTREELGVPKFDQREIVAVAQRLQQILKSGGREEDLYRQDAFKGEKDKMERPKSVIDVIVDGHKKELDKEEAQRIIIEDVSKEYVEAFNQDYHTKYDKEFMEKLIKQYGQEQVKHILDRMRTIQTRDGSIHNPAGYLTQSLKNSKRDELKMRGPKGEDPFEK